MEAANGTRREFSSPWLVSAWATACAVGLFLCGVFTCLSFSMPCWLVGFYTIMVSLFTAILEAPLLWRLSPWTEKLHSMCQSLVYWQKGAMYFVMVLPEFACLCIASFIAMTLILSNGVGYFVLAIGPKGTRPPAQQPIVLKDDGREGLVNNAAEMGRASVRVA